MAANVAREAAGGRPWRWGRPCQKTRQGRVLGSTAGLGRYSRYGSKEGVGSCWYIREERSPAPTAGCELGRDRPAGRELQWRGAGTHGRLGAWQGGGRAAGRALPRRGAGTQAGRAPW